MLITHRGAADYRSNYSKNQVLNACCLAKVTLKQPDDARALQRITRSEFNFVEIQPY